MSAEAVEVNTLTVTAGASSAGNITIKLDTIPFTVALEATDTTAANVAARIRAATFDGWVVSGSDDTVVFTSTSAGPRTTGTFDGGATSAAATFAKTTTGAGG